MSSLKRGLRGDFSHWSPKYRPPVQKVRFESRRAHLRAGSRRAHLRANSADAILLIVAALSDGELIALKQKAEDHELDVLCEVHDQHELDRALDAGCNLIGVNSRDLRTFKVDLKTAFRLAERLPDHVLAVAESGIESGTDIAQLRSAGYGAFLIGETLMRADKPGEALKSLLVDASAASAIAR